MRRISFLSIAVAAGVWIFAACGKPPPAPLPTATSTATPAAAVTATPAPAPTVVPTSSPSPFTPTPQRPTATPTPGAPTTPLPARTATSLPAATPTALPVPTPTPLGGIAALSLDLATAAPSYGLLLNPSICGAQIVASDGQLLGKVSGNPYDPDSIVSETGSYGSGASSSSIWNRLGQYGNETGPKSAFNDFSTGPPQLVKGKEVIGYVTTGSLSVRRVNPLELRSWLLEGNCAYR